MSSPYTLKFMPSAGVNTMITAYTNYLHAVNPAITAMNIRFRLSDAGTGATAVPGASIGPPYTFTWLWNGASPNNPIFFPASQMVVNHWYRIDTTISLNGGLQFFGRECANTYIDVNIAAQGNQRVFRVRTQDGKQQESRFNAGGRPTL
jgi:hypothetical protein